MSQEALLSNRERQAYYDLGKKTPFVSSLGALPLAMLDFPLLNKIRSKTLERLQMRALGAGRADELLESEKGKFLASSYLMAKNRTRQLRSLLGFSAGAAGTVLATVAAAGAVL